MGDILMILFFLLAPAGVLWACRRVKLLNKEGPVLVLYILGIIVGNVFHPAGMAKIQDLLSSAMVPLAIPIMLFACTFSSGLNTLGYLTFVIFISLFIQVILARIFRIDADTMTISSVTYICSPPFVPMMSAAMKNRSVLASGLAIGVVGYAAGTYLGFIISQIL